MGTRVIKQQETAQVGNKASVFNTDQFAASISALMDKNVVFGSGSPLYDLVAGVGAIQAANTPDKALNMDFQALKKHMKPGTAHFVQGKFDNIQLAIRTSDGIMFAGVLHDAEGKPVEDVHLNLCVVEANREFEVPGADYTIEKGDRFIKALPEKYVSRLKKAA